MVLLRGIWLANPMVLQNILKCQFTMSKDPLYFHDCYLLPKIFHPVPDFIKRPAFHHKPTSNLFSYTTHLDMALSIRKRWYFFSIPHTKPQVWVSCFYVRNDTDPQAFSHALCKLPGSFLVTDDRRVYFLITFPVAD